ncbi:MAG: Foldase protein PrsA precursor [Pelotomaculum sp. PtaU1.Bin035]|nr:MAG: Foldase protein PrsA precursor [Pelotomaculum sp. PtaU1.Bin035]
MRKKLKFWLLAPAALAILMFSGCGGDIVATVNGEKITGKELEQRVDEVKTSMEKQGVDFSGDNANVYMESLRKKTLEDMIDSKLILQEARKSGKLTPEQVQEKIKPLKEQFSSGEEYENFLDQVKMSEEEVAYILNLQEQVTKDVPPVSEEDVKKYYDENQKQFEQPEQLQVRHILFFSGDQDTPVKHTDTEAKQMAEEVIAQLNQGKDFAELAKEKSEDSATKDNGGLYTFSEGQAVKEFSDAAYALGPGEYTQSPVKTEYGYHVIKMEKRIPAVQYSYDQIKQRLADQLSEQAKQGKFNDFMQEVRNKATIVNKLAEKEESNSKK